MYEFTLVLSVCIECIYLVLLAVSLICSGKVNIPKPRRRLFRIRLAIDTGAEIIRTCFTFQAKTSVEAVEMLRDCINESLPLNYRIIEGTILD